MLIAALFAVAKKWKQPKYLLIDKWIKIFYIYYMYIHTHTHRHTQTHNGMLLNHKKNEILSFAATWTDPQGILLNEMTCRQILYDFTYMWNLFILFMGSSRQEYWSGLPFPSPVDHILSELSTMTYPSWVALHGMAHSFMAPWHEELTHWKRPWC